MNARKMIKVALICASAMVGVTAAEAMPIDSAVSPAAGAALGSGAAQVDKVVIIVGAPRRRVVRVRPVVRAVRRPAIIVR